jgi:Uma2 family endonuclease
MTQLVNPQKFEIEESETQPFAAPDISHLELEDDTPLDNFQTEKQQRLLVEPLYSSWKTDQPYIAAANVGIFGSVGGESIAPDVFLSLEVAMPQDWSQRQNRSYLMWEFGKMPEVVIEIVSNRKGNELVARNPEKSAKKISYARMGIGYYAVFDSLLQIQEPEQMNGQLLQVFVLTGKHYTALPAPHWLEDVGLGLTLWEGEFEGVSGQWLRWCDRTGAVIPTGAEARDAERQRSQQLSQERDAERERSQRLAARLRAMGIDPDQD